jgi:hypothetical protein
MGWNRGYTIMEKQVVGLYDLGVLDKSVLCALMEPFRNTDIDHGGCHDLRSKDGKSADDIICFVMEPERYKTAVDNFVPYKEDEDDEELCYYNDKLSDLWYEITRREWEFW